ncbi:hypothetical protein NEMBOFW57_008775 [Staphylotrichum longicolle]|uniref:Oxidoreductase-like domain-containing protein n=1 Tax=Staphylotrichum longicolle TaxID=669026 RepID=A0AAD4ESE8_9PEZI|nr:hypothetical protein NEMBOFW57_008775 [Staphylotrichum longicolle]
MRRTFLSARPARAVYRAFGSQQPRRTFATPPIKDDSPPSPIEPSKEQAHPVGPFYEAILRTPKPLPKEKPEEPPVTSQESPKAAPEAKPAAEEKPAASEDKTAAAAQEDKKPARRPRKPRQTAAAAAAEPKAKSVPSSSPSLPTPEPSTDQGLPSPEERVPPSNSDPLQADAATEPQPNPARVVFGSSLAGPAERAERLARLRAESRVVAGVRVPPKPEEPDNCCMSGCVNCVWDRYRDEMEEWAGASAEAERRLAAAQAGGAMGVTEESMQAEERGRGMELGVHDEVADRGAMGMEDDGGGSAANWSGEGKIVKDFWDEELYKNVPVGIREFMKQEKRLKEKHLREGSAGG